MRALIILAGCILIASFTFNEGKQKGMYESNQLIDSKKLDGNNISAWFTNNGRFNYNTITSNSGFEWPTGSGMFLPYTSGIWLAGKFMSDTLVAITNFSTEFLPGYINSSGVPEGKDNPEFKIYKIIKGDTLSQDYINWPVSQGAYLDSLNKPFLPGIQTIFFSMTDGYPESHQYTNPMRAQVQVTSWCYGSVNDPVISNTIFSEFKIINKNPSAWIDAVISVWSDECSGAWLAIGCDTNLNLGYSYLEPDASPYGDNPPAHGFLLLQGPAKYTGNSSDTVSLYIPGKNKRRIRIGYKETGFSSFNMFQNASFPYGLPLAYNEIYMTMQGLRRTGESWINPLTSSATKFPFPGDPESGSGWYQSATMGYGNRRLLMNFGLLNFNPGDTQTIVVAQLVSQGINNLNSVTLLKQHSVYIKNVFENNFTTVSINETHSEVLPEGFSLFQNFPNPFNPNTNITFELRKSEYVTLKVYDISGKEIRTLINGIQTAGKQTITFDGSDLSSGIYLYKLTAGNFSETKKMILSK
ncbi:MAG: T9SS type A sorting domain-containing protein [Ignavibacteria bacterium]|nr:T9SS type A sorting domain-containing protein [Ignavibacteria bacterium]